MPTVEATRFRRDFGRYQDEAHREIVTVTSHGRVIGGFLSAHELEHYQRLKQRERQVFRIEDAPEELVEAIGKAEYLQPGS